MTTKDVAGGAVNRALSGQRRALQPTGGDVFNWRWGKGGGWGTGKQGKTHLGLSVMSHAIYESKREGFAFKRGELLLPPKPLRTAYANFDRPADTVIENLQPGVDIVEEPLYLDGRGELLIPIAMGIADFEQLFQRFRAFAAWAREEEFEFLFADGGTVLWENMRRWKGIPPEKGAAPKEYQESNTEMRYRVMGLMEGLPMHTWITREAKEVWQSASGPVKTPDGRALMTDDGWSQTSHRIDFDVEIRLMQTQTGMERTATFKTALRPDLINTTVMNPTYAKLYRLNYGKPLLRKDDLDEYLRIVKEVEHIAVVDATEMDG